MAMQKAYQKVRSRTRDIYRWDPGTWDPKMSRWDLGSRTSKVGSRTWDLGPQNIQMGPRTHDQLSGTQDSGPQNIQVGPKTSNFL